MKKHQRARTCPKCGDEFSLQDFLTHPDLEPLGLSSDYANPEACHFYFCHRSPACMTSLTVPLEFFLPLVAEEIPSRETLTGEDCPRHCTTVADLRSCGCSCYQAPFRRFMLDLIRARETDSTA